MTRLSSSQEQAKKLQPKEELIIFIDDGNVSMPLKSSSYTSLPADLQSAHIFQTSVSCGPSAREAF